MRIAGGRPGAMQSGVCLFRSVLEHDPEKWIPAFGKDHAPSNLERDDDSKKSHHALESQAPQTAQAQAQFPNQIVTFPCTCPEPPSPWKIYCQSAPFPGNDCPLSGLLTMAR